MECGHGVVDRDGVRVAWSEDERKRVGGAQGTQAAWEARWAMMNVHLRHHFRHASFTDASKTHDAAAAGLWEGVQEPCMDDADAVDRVSGGSARVRAAAAACSSSANEQDERCVGR